MDMDDVASPTVKLRDAKRRASLLSSFLLEEYLYSSANEIIVFKS